MTGKKSSCDRCENWMEKAFSKWTYSLFAAQCLLHTHAHVKNKNKTDAEKPPAKPISNFRTERMCSCCWVKLINYSHIIVSSACGQKVFKPKTNVILDVNIQRRKKKLLCSICWTGWIRLKWHLKWKCSGAEKVCRKCLDNFCGQSHNETIDFLELNSKSKRIHRAFSQSEIEVDFLAYLNAEWLAWRSGGSKSDKNNTTCPFYIDISLANIHLPENCKS